MAVAGLVIGAAQLGIGLAEKDAAKKDAAKALSKRRAYQTPEEVYKILNATEQNAQSGFDPSTLQYLTNQTDQSFDAALSTSEKLGGDPNNLSALFNDKISSIMKIGAENHAQNLNNFNAYLGALGTLGQSKDAEFFSQQNLVKDAQQAAAYDKQVATGQISAGLNTGLASLSALEQEQLYKSNNPDTGIVGIGLDGKPLNQKADLFNQKNTYGYSNTTNSRY
jgi:hypothetical protein